MMAKRKSPLIGRWRITSMTQWDQEFVDAEVPGYVEFRTKGSGEFQFGYIQCQVDWREAGRDGPAAVEFSFDGLDEMTPISGRGWVVIEGATLDSRIFIHQGDESGLTARRAQT